MLTVTWLIAATTFVLLLGALFAEVVFKNRCGRQDAAWRYTLLAVALVPIVIVARGASPKFELPVAFLKATSSDTIANDSPSEPAARPRRSGTDESKASDAKYVFTGGSNDPYEEKDPLRWRLDSAADSPVWRTAPVAVTDQAQTTVSDEAQDGGSKSVALRLALVVWCSGALFSLGHLCVGWRRIRQISRDASPVDSAAWRDAMELAEKRAGLSADRLQICVSKNVSSPIAIGIFSPQVVLPQTMVDDCSDPRAEDIVAILTHEAVHIRRRDPIWNLLLQIVAAVWWIHPLSRLMKHRLVWLRELLCDGVVATTGNAEQYAETLLEFAVSDVSPGNVALAMQPPPGTLESRVRWILSQPSPVQLRPFRQSVVASVIAFACCAAMLITAVQFVPSALGEEKKSTKPAAPTEPPPHASGPTIQGVILTPDGKPSAKSKVYLRINPKGSYTLPVKKETATTSADGRFQFKSVKPGDYRVWAESKEMTTLRMRLSGQKVRVTEEPPADAKPLQLKLHPGCGYDVVVRDAATQEPIPDAKISFGWTDIDRQYQTNREGIAKIRQLGIADWYFVVRAEGYATVFKKTSEQELGSVLPMQFDLDPGAKLVVNLRDEKGDPLVGSTISVSPDDVSMAPYYERSATDAKGQFVASGLPIGRPLRLHSTKDGYAGVRHKFSIGDASKPTELSLESKKLPYGGDVVVTVLDASGKPLNNAKLKNRGNSSADSREATTDKNGKARIANVFRRYDGCSVVVRADGYIPQQQVFKPGTIEEPAELTVRLELGKTLRGQVVEPGGEPAAGLRVYYNGGNRMGDLGGRVTTDSKGEFVIHGLPDDTTITVYTPQRFAPINEQPVPVGEEEPVRIEMEVAGLIRVRALDAETGKPIPEFNVRVGFCEKRLPDDPRGSGISSSLVNPGVNIQGSKKEYQLGGQVVGMPYKVIVSAKGYETQPVARVLAERADQAELLDVRLDKTRAEDLQTVAGRIVDANGNPIPGASMRLLVGAAIPRPNRNGRMEGWRFYHWDLLVRDDIEGRDQCLQLLKTASDAEGRFEFKNVKAGTPWMELFYFGSDIMSQRYSNLRDRPEEELTALELSAPKPAGIKVQVDQKSFDNAHRASVEAVDYSRGPNSVKLAYSSENQDIQFVDGKAVLEFKNLPPGEYNVSLQAKPVATGDGGFMVRGITSKKIKVEAGTTNDVEFANELDY